MRVNTVHSRQVSLKTNGEGMIGALIQSTLLSLVFTADIQYHDNDQYSISTSDNNEVNILI